MSTHLQHEIDKIKRKLLALSGLVENRLHEAVRSLHARDGAAAQAVIDGDADIDQVEVELEEDCLKILALHQPVASDLRFLVSVLKINNDLERIGDLAVNIARKALAFSGHTEFQFPVDLDGIARKTEAMLRDSLDCLVHFDATLARKVCVRDEEVNDMKRAIRQRVEAEIQRHPEQAIPLLKLLGACRNLERVADQATNIAEDVVYLVDGQIIRHRNDWELVEGEDEGD